MGDGNMDIEHMESILKEAGRSHGIEVSVNCGLNSDWSVSAWMIGEGEPNLTNGAYYILDSEDGTVQLVRRWYPGTEEYEELEGPGGVETIEREVPLNEDNLRRLVVWVASPSSHYPKEAHRLVDEIQSDDGYAAHPFLLAVPKINEIQGEWADEQKFEYLMESPNRDSAKTNAVLDKWGLSGILDVFLFHAMEDDVRAIMEDRGIVEVY